MLRAFAFGNSFIDWVKLLYSNGTFQIRVNDSTTSVISFQCGVRQGCSLSASLFTLGLEPLVHHIRCESLISGIIPPGGQLNVIRKIIFTETKKFRKKLD